MFDPFFNWLHWLPILLSVVPLAGALVAVLRSSFRPRRWLLALLLIMLVIQPAGTYGLLGSWSQLGMLRSQRYAAEFSFYAGFTSVLLVLLLLIFPAGKETERVPDRGESATRPRPPSALLRQVVGAVCLVATLLCLGFVLYTHHTGPNVRPDWLYIGDLYAPEGTQLLVKDRSVVPVHLVGGFMYAGSVLPRIRTALFLVVCGVAIVASALLLRSGTPRSRPSD